MTSSGMLLHGMQAIADFLGVSRRVAYHMAGAKQIPTFKMGATVCADRALLAGYMQARAAAALAPKAPSDAG